MKNLIVAAACLISGTAFAQGSPAQSLGLSIPAAPQSTEALLKISYRVRCDNPLKNAIRTIPGEIRLGDRTIRFDLFEANTGTELHLGALSDGAEAEILTLASDHCEIVELLPSLSFEPVESLSLGDFSSLALEHSPFIAVRDDQFANRFTDLPLSMVYNVEQGPNGHITLKYTCFFSDEDSKGSLSGTDGQLARYGRRTDVEWTYLVELDRTMNVVRSLYQGGFSLISPAPDLGHSFQKFNGRYIPGTRHPILYNSARNNVFSDAPRGAQAKRRLTGHHLVPREEILYPSAREWAMFNQPWMFRVSDLELSYENKLTSESTDYLYILVQGKHSGGSFRARMSLDDGTQSLSGNGHSNVDRLGEDMWWKEAFTAIPFDRSRIQDLLAGKLRGRIEFESTSLFFMPLQLEIESLRFFRLVSDGTTYTAEEITERVPGLRCNLAGVRSACSF